MRWSDRSCFSYPIRESVLLRKKSLLFLAPAFLIYTFLMIIPILGAFFLSLTDWNGISQNYGFVGLHNYIAMFKDERFLNAVLVTLRITFTVTIATNVIGLFVAVLLNNAGKLTNVYRSVFFLPYVISTVAISFIWLSILSYTGVMNSALEAIGLTSLVSDHIGNTESALRSICVIEIWRTMGFHMVLYLASLQTVPEELYEVCTVDGGTKFEAFRYITLPLIVPGATVSVIMSIMMQMKQYDIVKVITNGGPGYSTETISYNIVTQAFGNNMLGYSSALAVFLFAVIAVISIVQLKLSSRWER